MKLRALHFLLLAAVLIDFQCLFSQERQLGTWKMFLSYNSSNGVFDGGDRVYCMAPKSFFSCEKATGVIQLYDKSTGLSDLGIQAADYDSASKFLAIAYTDDNMDFIQNGTDIYNLPDFMNASTSGALIINSISFYGGSAYVSTNIGISQVDLTKMEISNTYIIGPGGVPENVFSSTIDGTNIYAATSEGIKFAPLNSPNLLDFNNWTLFDSAQNIPNLPAHLVSAYNGKVYAVLSSLVDSDLVYRFNGTNWTNIYSVAGDSVVYMKPVNGNLYFDIFSAAGNGKHGKIDTSGNVQVNPCQYHSRPNGWFESQGISWESDAYNGLYKINQGSVDNIVPDGPFRPDVFALDAKNKVLNVAPGGVDQSWGYLYNRDGFFIYKDGKWINRNKYSDPDLSNYSDILAVASVPALNKTYFGSFYAGLIEYDDNTGGLTLFDNTNSLLEVDQGDNARTKISCMYVDDANNVWIGNAGALHPIKVIEPNGTWRQFSVPYSFALSKKIIIDDYGQLWAPLRSETGGGVLVMGYTGTIDSPGTILSRVLYTGAGYGNLPDDNVFCIAKDHDGNIWVGTDVGLGTFYCPGNELATGGCDGEQIKVTLNGFVNYLFATQTVQALAVDAANRLWVGTTNGIWLISNDGQTNYLNFTTDNSPLPANEITDISIDNTTGEVFIGTEGGLVSYQGDAIDTCIGCTEALVYPNPVHHDYTGPIAIKGLVDNAYVKITDITGTLIYQGQANGTQMIWNGAGYEGNRAKSGVYLVFSADASGKERRVAKILLMN